MRASEAPRGGDDRIQRKEGRKPAASVPRPPGRPGGETDARIDSDEPDFIVVDERVALGPRQRALAATYARWMNQLEVRRSLADLSIFTPQSQEKWVEKNIERERPN